MEIYQIINLPMNMYDILDGQDLVVAVVVTVDQILTQVDYLHLVSTDILKRTWKVPHTYIHTCIS